MGKFPNPNPNFTPNLNNSFSREKINVDDFISEDTPSCSFGSDDISGSSTAELRKSRVQFMSELDKDRNLSTRLENGSKKRPSPFEMSNSKRFAGNSNTKVSQQVMKSCEAVLKKLSSNGAGIWFNSPVDAVGMGLHDYFTVIAQPMDLGTIKDRLDKGFYATPEEFGSDVRLTFNNALKYSCKGFDVRIFAEQCLGLFERWFKPILAEYESEKQVHLQDNSSKMPKRVEVESSVVGEDLIKREMSLDEKKKLELELQNLPPEKMSHVLHIVRKRNGNLNQDGDEIEFDLEGLDNETLWELDRFVIHFNKIKTQVDTEGDEIDYTNKFVIEGMTFNSVDEAYDWAQTVAHKLRFGLTKAGCKHRPEKGHEYYRIICENGGKYRGKKTDPGKMGRNNTSTKKCGCAFRFNIRSKDYGRTYYIEAVANGGKHNHGFLVYTDGHRPMTAFRAEHLEFVEEQVHAKVSNKNIKQRLITKFGDTMMALPVLRQIQYQSSKIKKNKHEGKNSAQKAGVSDMMAEKSSKLKNGGGSGGDVGEEDVDIGDEIPVNNSPPLEIDKDDEKQHSDDSLSILLRDLNQRMGSDSDVDDAQSHDNESKNYRQ